MDRALVRHGSATVGAFAVLALAGASCGNPFRAVSIFPIYAYEDGCTTVTIGGTSFEPDGFEVRFDGQAVEVTWPEPDSIDYGYSVTAAVPDGHAPGTVKVEVVSGGQTQEIDGGFTYVACGVYDADGNFVTGPRVDGALLLDADSNIVPYAGLAGGELLYIAGCGFDASTQVLVNGAPAEFTAGCSTELFVTVPPSDAYGTAFVTIATDGGENQDVAFDYNCAGPEFSGVDPASLDGGASTTAWVSGCGFYDDGVVHTTAWIDAAEPALDENTGLYGPVEGTMLETTVLDAFTLEVVFPPHDAGAVDLLLANPEPSDVSGLTTLAYVTAPQAATYFAPLAVDLVAPDFGEVDGGYAVDLYGSGFSTVESVSWNGAPLAPAEYQVVDDGHLSVPSAPPGSVGPVPIGLTQTGSGFTAEATFVYVDSTP